MRRVTRNGLVVAVAASGAMAVTMPVHADSAAGGGTAGSPGLISGNTIQLPVHVPVNVCGNTVNVAGLLNPAAGNSCANKSAGKSSGATHGGAVAHGGPAAQGGAKDSPGVLSGNDVQLPVHLPVNVSGNTVGVVGIGSAAVGNQSANTSGGRPDHPAPRHHTPPRPYRPVQPLRPIADRSAASLAHTGTDETVPTIAASAALVLGGALLYRRFRPVRVR